MEHQVKYQLNVSIDAMDAALKAVLGDKATPAYKTAWVELCDPIDEDDERYAMIEFPDARNPEMTRTLFFKLMCAALPASRHECTGFFVTASADAEKDGKPVTAVHFQDGYEPKWDDGRGSTFWYKGELFSHALQGKLNAIGKILREGNDNEY